MVRKIERGTVVLARDPYNDSGRRPFVIISDENYPFYPNGYLGVPLTRKDKHNTVEIHESHKEEVFEEFEKDSNYVNPWSPVQVNDAGRALCRLSEAYMDNLAKLVSHAVGGEA